MCHYISRDAFSSCFHRNSGQWDHSQNKMGLSKGWWVAPMEQIFTFRERFHPPQDHIFKVVHGLQLLRRTRSWWQWWYSPGLHCLASQGCSCPDYFVVMDRESYQNALEKFFYLSSNHANGSVFLCEPNWNFSKPAVAFEGNSAGFTWSSLLITKR